MGADIYEPENQPAIILLCMSLSVKQLTSKVKYSDCRVIKNDH